MHPATPARPPVNRAWPGLALLVALVLLLAAGCTRPGAVTPGQTRQHLLAQALAYARCMRSHGVPDYRDPTTSGGGISLNPGKGVDPNTPQFRAAQQACRTLLPGPGGLSPEQRAEARQDGLRMAECMHAHGFPTFPEPNSEGVITITPADGIDTSSPRYKSAAQVCAKGMIIIAQVHGSPHGAAGQ